MIIKQKNRIFCSSGDSIYILLRFFRAFFYTIYGGKYFSQYIDYAKGLKYCRYEEMENDKLIIYLKGFRKKEVSYLFLFLNLLEQVIVGRSINKLLYLSQFKKYPIFFPKLVLKKFEELYEKD